ncbi:hypothetical protein JF737_19855 [Mycobacterium avium]|uniref:hypothetical protein n=1 Tax=Mycobacterium avium TaxID=1764 RepID=UPI001CD92BB5|nr:hypothetical protein [Mycobacterium avium]MBN3459176.1 hypothetical protein [Mycobacterium sp. DSM 3803]MCA2239957.1 hypothetical protein [Mycobacterium avium]MCA2258658.1 hypothetical protein [Mycobacterium avium]MCA2270368.1 hypothetical protein [Mycobacterium avium]MCA2280373.1 hypothetical protein [Mycobacterium avium]
MTIVGGLDVHRQPITFDCVDGELGSDSSGNAQGVAGLAAHCPDRDAEFALRSSRWL